MEFRGHREDAGGDGQSGIDATKLVIDRLDQVRPITVEEFAAIREATM